MSNTLERHFEAMGARLRVEEMPKPTRSRRRTRWSRWNSQRLTTVPRRAVNLNIRDDVFVFRIGEGAEVNVLNIDAKGRHLLLHVNDNGDKNKYLCGHDERHWFISPIPEATVSTVAQAKQALQPVSVREASKGIRNKNRLRRRNSAFVRQGEWFFTPDPDFGEPDPRLVHHNDPISRSAGAKPHIVEYLYRQPGQTVYISGSRRLSVEEYNALSAKERRQTPWFARSEVTAVWAKGRVSHADHATITLVGWHRIELNREQLAGMASTSAVSFID